MDSDTEIRVLNRLMDMIKDVKNGLDPTTLADWYNMIEHEAKVACPEELRKTISVQQDPILPMKFEFKASRRSVPYIINAIENNLDSMPYATRLYFLKLEEIIQQEYSKP